MGSIFKKVLRIAAPIGLSVLAPGVGTAIGGALGATGATAGVLGNALIGGATGALSGGGLKGALLGAASGGAGSYLSSSGAIGNATTSGAATAAKSVPSGLGSALKSGISNIASTNGLGTLASGYQSYQAQKDAEDQLRRAQGRSEAELQPYRQAGLQGLQSFQQGFDPSQITKDAGYQFRLAEGTKGLERSLAARGLGDSGAAQKAIQDYGQGQAAQAYNDAYQQWYNRNAGLTNLGQNATGSLLDTYANQGNIGANAGIARSNIVSGTLSDLLRGSRSIIGYDSNGNPIYSQ